MEPNLKNSFADLFDTLDEENCELIAHNLESPTPTRIRVIDFVQILGASINRAHNRLNGVRAMNFGPIRNGTVPNFLLYMPTNFSQIKTMSVNLELLIRFESNIKLDIRSLSDKETYLKDE